VTHEQTIADHAKRVVHLLDGRISHDELNPVSAQVPASREAVQSAQTAPLEEGKS
jgi:hypothetical protein